MIFSAYSCPVDLPIKPASATSRWPHNATLEKDSFLRSLSCSSPLHALLDHSEVPVPDDFADLVLLVDEGGGDGAIAVHCEETGGWIKALETTGTILKHPPGVFVPHAAEQSNFYTRAPSASSACSAAPLTSAEEAPRGVYEEKKNRSNVKRCKVAPKISSKILQGP